MSDPAENRGVRGNVIKPHETQPVIPLKQPFLSEAAVLNLVGVNLGTGLSFDSNKNLINATANSGINRVNSAETFEEPEVSISGDLGAVNNNLEITSLADGTTLTYNQNNTYTGNSAGQDLGLGINPNKDLLGIRLTPWAGNSGLNGDSVYLEKTDGTVLDSTTYVDNSTDITLKANLNSGTDYRVYVTTDSTTDTAYADPNNVYESTDIDSAGGYAPNFYGSTIDDGSGELIFKSVTALEGRSSGTGNIEWATERDVNEWDTATYQQTPDGGTVNVYVAYNDGNGWTRSNNGNPISRGYDLGADSNIDPSDNVRLEVSLSAPSTSENPRLESAYLSWQV